MPIVVGTAGHIDHGKTTLLRALTGIDADRLPEERRRGMTIDVGYAHAELAAGTSIDFVDVPGHDRLVGNMLVGAGEIDAALLVVAADDGPRAQTIEHLELLDALGIGHGLLAITKLDLVAADRTRATEVAQAVRDLLAGSSLEEVATVAVSAATGEGLDALRHELERLVDRVDSERAASAPPSGALPEPPRSRLAVDRAFAVRGRGTVVTGTLRGGDIAPGRLLRLLPEGAEVRVREVQVHGEGVERAGPGRAALNVAGVDVQALRRGSCLTDDPAVVATDRLLVALRPSLGSRRAPGDDRPAAAGRSEVRLHIGTDQVDARIERSARWDVEASDLQRLAVLRLARPIAAAPGE
ncbi:MAG TPA: selenocysteine-specific translation elongation factor, partial [Candidatus Dormibacteraeota bacterium]|nr:selenocysteine-specific translation elongation factor [Candidatus Dormibacteraeota bacterium]